MYTRSDIYLDGGWVQPHGNGTLAVENPATEQMIGSVPLCDKVDVDRAVEAARRALPGWRALSPADRSGFLTALQQAVAKRLDGIVQTIIDEMGAPLRIASRIQAQLPVSVLGQYAEIAASHSFEERVGNSVILSEPIGVVAAITPWNYPLHQLVVKVSAALAAGATVVAKPSELTPLSAYHLFDAADEVGLPPGVLNLVLGDGPTIGEALASHPGIDMVSLTGSTRAGKRVLQLCQPRLARVSLELGGKSASIILRDANLDTAVKVSLANAFLNTGQTCTAWTRLLVDKGVYADVIDRIIQGTQGYQPGDPHNEKTKLGPLVSATQRDRVRTYIEKGIRDGGTILVGGPDTPDGLAHGYFMAPTVFTDVEPGATIAQEEIFGPVLSVIPVASEKEAVQVANHSRYGLSGAVWSEDQDRAFTVARQMETGSVDINGGAYNPLAPFGGYKESGLGREMGRWGLEEFLQTKAIQL